MMTAVEKIRKSLQEVGIEIAYRWHLIWLARRTGKSIEWWGERIKKMQELLEDKTVPKNLLTQWLVIVYQELR